MNHFLLPGRDNGTSKTEAERYGVHLRELLVNGVLKHGASCNWLQANLFDGAKMMHSLKNIGSANAKFAQEFLDREAISLVGSSPGGETGRRFQYWPSTGRARQLFMDNNDPTLNTRSIVLTPNLRGGDLELF